MDHPRLEETWLDLAEGTLPSTEAEALRAHLAACAKCGDRFQRLEAAHRLSLEAGRRLAAAPAPAVPPALAERVLGAARRAAPPPSRPARAWWLAGGLAVAAAAVLFVAVNRGDRGASDDSAFATAALDLLAGPAGGVRAGREAAAVRARAVTDGIGGGRLRVRASRLRCPGGDQAIAAVLGPGGAVAALLRQAGDRTDVWLWADDGAAAGAVRLVGGEPSEFVLPPISQAEAWAALDAPRCASR
jgi:hypothetical protein